MAFVDLEKAYDSLPRSKLWSVLPEYGVNGKLLDAIKSLYVNCRAAVRIDGKLSDWFDVNNGVRQGCTISPLLFIIYMDKLIKDSNLKGKVVLGNNEVSSLAYADDLCLFSSSEEELQSNINDLEVACRNFGMKINSSKIQVMHVGKTRKSINCTLNGNLLEQVSQFKYLGCMFSEDGSLNKEFEHRKINGNKLVAQLRSHVFCKKELSTETKLLIHNSIYRPTIMYGSESWVDSANLIHDLEVADMKVIRMISGVSRRDQWENRISNEAIRADLNVDSVDEVARRSRLRWYGHVERMEDFRLPKRILYSEVDGRRNRGRPRRRFLDSVKSDMNERGLEWGVETSRIALNRVAWRRVVKGN